MALQPLQENCCEGNEILCISIPTPVTIVLSGQTLTLELPCIRITSEDELTPEEVNQILQVLANLLASLGGSIQN